MVDPVVCPLCGKMFPVPREAVGRDAECPYCQKVVAFAPAAAPKPLSLDDAVQLPRASGGREPPGAIPHRSFRVAHRGSRTPLVRLLVLLLVCGVVFAGAFAVFRFGPVLLGSSGWREFAPADGGCRAMLPGEPVEEPIPANPASPVSRGGKRFVVKRWFERMTASIGWLDLDPSRAKLTRAEDAIGAQKDRRAVELGGTIVREAAVKQGQYDGRQVEFATPDGPWTERYVYVSDGPYPRLYIVAVGGAGAPAESEAARRVLGSLRLE